MSRCGRVLVTGNFGNALPDTLPLMQLYAKRVGAEMVVVGSGGMEKCLSRYKAWLSKVNLRSGCRRSMMYRLFAVRQMLMREGVSSVMWLDDSCVIKPGCPDLFAMVEGTRRDGQLESPLPPPPVAAFNPSGCLGHAFTSHSHDIPMIAKLTGVTLDRREYLSMSVLVCRRDDALLGALSDVEMARCADLLSGAGVDEPLFNALLRIHNIPVTFLPKAFNSMFLNECSYNDTGRRLRSVSRPFLLSPDHQIMNVSGFYRHRADLLRAVTRGVVEESVIVEISHSTADVFRAMLAIHNCVHGLGVDAARVVVKTTMPRPTAQKFWPTIEAAAGRVRWNEVGYGAGGGDDAESALETTLVVRVDSRWVVDWAAWKRTLQLPCVPVHEVAWPEKLGETGGTGDTGGTGETGKRPWAPLALYTVCTGGYEGQRVLLRREGVRVLRLSTMLFTDDWANYMNHRSSLYAYYIHRCWTPKLLQRTIKHLPQLFLPDPIKASVYVDGNRTLDAGRALKCLDELARGRNSLGAVSSIAMICYAHPERKTPRAEAAVVVVSNLESSAAVNGAIGHLESLGVDLGSTSVGLTETNVLVRDHTDVPLRAACMKIAEMCRECRRDQIVFDGCLALFGVRFMRLAHSTKPGRGHAHVNPTARPGTFR